MEAHVVPVAHRAMPRLVRERRWWLVLANEVGDSAPGAA